MKSEYIVGSCSRGLNRMMIAVGRMAQQSMLIGRLLALPLGLLLGLSLPLIRITSFLEKLLLFVINGIGFLIVEDCTLRDAGGCLMGALREIIGIFLSPFMAVFVSTALVTSMLVDPRKATERFALTCQNRAKQCG